MKQGEQTEGIRVFRGSNIQVQNSNCDGNSRIVVFSLTVTEHWNFTPFLQAILIAPTLKIWKVFLFTSKREGWGRKLRLG